MDEIASKNRMIEADTEEITTRITNGPNERAKADTAETFPSEKSGSGST